jgi:outer membrane lipoprotein carrier protein
MHMRKLWSRIAKVLIMTVATTAAGLGEETAQEVLEKVKGKYDAIKDGELKFTQRVKFSMAKIEQSVSGTLVFKKENKYRVELEEQTIVTDGETVWSYSLPNNQVLIDRFKTEEGGLSPERILTASPADFAATLLGKEKVGKTDAIVLKLVPRSEESLVKGMKLWVDEGDWMMKKVELTDVNGKVTTYTVTEFRVNIGVSDARFKYQIPEGTDVVDLR